MVKGILPAIVLSLLAPVASISSIEAATNRGTAASRQSYWIGSARSAGMGHLVATLDDGAAAVWNNPASLGFEDRWFARGTSCDWEGAWTDRDYRFRSFTAGGRVTREDAPVSFGLGWQRFDLGDFDVISESGHLTGTWHTYEDLVNLAAATEIAGVLGAGLALEYTRDHLGPPIPEQDLEEATGSAFSMNTGVTYRPEFRSAGRSAVSEDGAAPVLRLCPVAAVSLLHWGQEMDFDSYNASDPLPRRLHYGVGVGVGVDPPGGSSFPSRLLAFDLFAGYEWEHYLIGSEETIKHFGFEARIAKIFSVRLGHIDERDDWTEGNTRGLGVGLEDLSPLGFRVDYGKAPLGRYLPDTERWELNLFYNPRGRAEWRKTGGTS